MSKFKVGDRVEVVANTANHGVAIGTKSVICGLPPAHGAFRIKDHNLNFNEHDLKLCHMTKEDLEGDLKLAQEKAEKAQDDVEMVEAKIAYMDETGSETFDENEFRCYEALKIIEGEDDRLAKAKAIAKLVR